MSDGKGEELHPVVVALAADFDLFDEQWAVPDERLFEHHKKLLACGVELRDKLVTDLVVLAARLQREAAAKSDIALIQLMALAAGVLGGAEAAAEAFEGAGVDVAEAKKLIGGDGVKFEDGAGAKPGEAAASLLGMLKDNK